MPLNNNARQQMRSSAAAIFVNVIITAAILGFVSRKFQIAW